MKLKIIIGSTRPNRITPQVAKWVAAEAKAQAGTEVEILDLADYPMPFFDEPISPRYNPDRKINPDVKKWLDKLAEGDAFVFVSPEYNHSIPGVLKNSLDYVTSELTKKPVTVASHGSVGGARAAMHLREILSESGGINITRQVAVSGASEKINADGELNAEQKANPYGPQTALKAMLEELRWHSDLLAAARK